MHNLRKSVLWQLAIRTFAALTVGILAIGCKQSADGKKIVVAVTNVGNYHNVLLTADGYFANAKPFVVSSVGAHRSPYQNSFASVPT